MGLWDHIRARVYDLAPEYEEAFSKSFNKVFPNKGAEKTLLHYEKRTENAP